MLPTPMRVPRILLTAVLAVLAAAVVSACGSSSSSSSSSSAASSSGASSSTGSAQFAKYQSCLKSHGVTLPNRGTFKRPSGTGTTGGFTPPGGEAGTPPSGAFKRGKGGGFAGGARSKQDQAAFKACAKDAPTGRGGFGAGGRPGGAGGGTGTQFSAATLSTFAACVKQHGYTLPKANTSGTGPVYPRSIETNKTFEAASKPCQSLLRPSGAPASAGASG